MDRLTQRINLLLTTQRLKYPYYIGGALWLGWIISIIAGKGNTDLAGHLIGTDFAAFYTAGKIILMGRGDELYNLELANTIQQHLYGTFTANFNPYLNPPFYALLFAPFALIPYPWSPILWMGLGLFLFWVSLHLLEVTHPLHTFIISLTWLPIFYATSFGQNTFLTIFIFCLIYRLWMNKNSGWAGVAASLLLFKPQFLFGLVLLWLLEWRKNWRNLMTLALVSSLLIAISYLYFPKASLDYIRFVQSISANLMLIEGFPMWNAASVQSFWLALLPGLELPAKILYLACAILGIFVFLKYWYRQRDQDVSLFIGIVFLTLWVTPYLMIYDWSLLIIPALIIWERCPELRIEWRVIFTLIWVISLLYNVLNYIQLRFLPLEFQILIPSLVFIGYKFSLVLKRTEVI